jgi:hypothetical protein
MEHINKIRWLVDAFVDNFTTILQDARSNYEDTIIIFVIAHIFN